LDVAHEITRRWLCGSVVAGPTISASDWSGHTARHPQARRRAHADVAGGKRGGISVAGRLSHGGGGQRTAHFVTVWNLLGRARTDERFKQTASSGTFDLWQDCGEFTLTGITPTAMGGPAFFDRIELRHDRREPGAGETPKFKTATMPVRNSTANWS
jgi:hypothetical protein